MKHVPPAAAWLAIVGTTICISRAAIAESSLGETTAARTAEPVRQEPKATTTLSEKDPGVAAGAPASRGGSRHRSQSDTARPTHETGRTAGARPREGRRTARLAPKPPCFHDAIEIERGFGSTPEPMILALCNGKPAPHAIEQLSILSRPMSAPLPPSLASAPTASSAASAMTADHSPGLAPSSARSATLPNGEWQPGIKLLDEGLIVRLQQAVDHFRAKKVIVVSGYRPSSVGSFHQSGHALDFLLDGVRNEALVAFCRTLEDTGCGYYPNSSFIHMDVRPAGTGHPYWIDSSGPGERPHYVSSWPPPRNAAEYERNRATASIVAGAPDDEHTHLDMFLPWASAKNTGRPTARSLERTISGGSTTLEDPFHP